MATRNTHKLKKVLHHSYIHVNCDNQSILQNSKSYQAESQINNVPLVKRSLDLYSITDAHIIRLKIQTQAVAIILTKDNHWFCI
ncbi:hypothetical protein HanRHA438_Chr07g0296491 [Helianthus annuus]|nr:hypothetical protein HanRHA438_Chr07g0296491 [Helianthus annuus]